LHRLLRIALLDAALVVSSVAQTTNKLFTVGHMITKNPILPIPLKSIKKDTRFNVQEKFEMTSKSAVELKQQQL
jgi:hypothetical protein